MLSLVLEAAAQQSVDIGNLKSGDVERIESGLTSLLEKRTGVTLSGDITG